ncbi:ATP-binding protein [Actinomadura rupiterrae]|uniref:ATP-binding protein n=1 Tax=Actinomadura rupiterrae TaxID=559627 RepID=UPI0020A39E13|nr:ATP-binding protein [Actinomadura rupiterrae]MCP2334729.1 signal transduction histidine kinase [Actinomadura rupiterrae]
MERALAVWLVAVVVLGAAWLYGVFKAGHDLRPVVAWAGGGAALALCVTLAVAAYYAALARRAWDAARAETGGAASLERQIAEVADSTMPALLHRVAAGAPAEAVLGEILPPADPGLRRVLRLVAQDGSARRRDASSAQAVLDGLEKEVDRIIDEAMPVIVERIRRDRVGPETVLPEVGEPDNPLLRRLLTRVVTDLATGERGSAAAMMSCANAAARIQAACTRLLGDLRDLEHRYGDDPVFHDLLDIDHEVSQAGRIADSIALLAGGRSGRRWTKPIVMESILRGAMGRIHDYRRVKLHFTTGSAIAGYAAEGVMHCLAELMDNAASFSAANTDVHVYVEEEDAGIVVTIEDSGLGMRQRERARAERLVNEPSDLTALPGTRLGLAVVGRLAAKHGLRISFRPSSRGGTAAIVLIPRQLVTQPRQDLLPPELREPWDGSSRPPLAGTGLPSPETTPLTPGELLFDAASDGAAPSTPTASAYGAPWTDDDEAFISSASTTPPTSPRNDTRTGSSQPPATNTARSALTQDTDSARSAVPGGTESALPQATNGTPTNDPLAAEGAGSRPPRGADGTGSDPARGENGAGPARGAEGAGLTQGADSAGLAPGADGADGADGAGSYPTQGADSAESGPALGADGAESALTRGANSADGAGSGGPLEDGDEDDGFELPQRRRGATLAASPDPIAQAVGRDDENRPAPGARFAAFRSATGGPRTVARDTGGIPTPSASGGTTTAYADPATEDAKADVPTRAEADVPTQIEADVPAQAGVNVATEAEADAAAEVEPVAGTGAQTAAEIDTTSTSELDGAHVAASDATAPESPLASDSPESDSAESESAAADSVAPNSVAPDSVASDFSASHSAVSGSVASESGASESGASGPGVSDGSLASGDGVSSTPPDGTAPERDPGRS